MPHTNMHVTLNEGKSYFTEPGFKNYHNIIYYTSAVLPYLAVYFFNWKNIAL